MDGEVADRTAGRVSRRGAAEPRYGWVVVAVGALSIGLQSGIHHAGALFLVAISEETGWSRVATAAAISSAVLGNGAWAPVVGALIQRWGPRRAIPLAALVASAGLAVLSVARGPLDLSIAFLLLVAPGAMGIGTLANFTAIQAWFKERRGTALSLADCGASLGLVLVVPLTQQLIASYGWRGAYQALALMTLLLIPLHLMLQRPAPAREQAAPAIGSPAERGLGAADLARIPHFWLAGLGLMATWFALQLVNVHQVAYLTDQGFDPSSIATAYVIIGLTGLVGRPGFGWLSDRLGVRPTFGLVTACLVVAIGSLALAGQSGRHPPLWLFAFCFGAGTGVGTLLFASQVSSLFGSRSFGTAMGLVYLFASVGGVSGATAAGLVYDLSRTYLTSFAAAGVALLLSCACMWLVARGPRR
jgi:predicted MFS family arabinose efflux permease